MPYSDPAKEAERKRRYRHARRSSPILFARWFRECIDDIVAQNDRPAWSTRLAEVMQAGDESDKALRRYYSGEIERPRAEAAYRVGWGLYDLGLRWCNGPIALLAAKHYSEFFGMLASLSGGDEESRCCCQRLVFAGFSAASPIESGTPGKGFHQQMRLTRDDARKATTKASKLRFELDNAWELRRSLAGRQRALPEFALAVDIVERTVLDERIRIYGALAVIAKAVNNADREKEVNIIKKLEGLSPIATRPSARKREEQ
ncbi:MAG: hypothetical protein ABIZ82_05295 [Candidatus Tumulicola sp.]